ncbi:MAG TPA: class I SAM-dependent methyltransferase [Roseivirga sp.]
MKLNNFNRVAPIYDLLAKLIFGNSLLRAQSHFLKQLPENKRVLFVGGGTGQLLNHSFFTKASHVEYLELSEQMIERAKLQAIHHKNIDFIQGNFFDCQGKYDVIICNFFLDCFNETNLKLAVEHLYRLSSSQTTLVVTDFNRTDKLRHKMLIKMMILFFSVFSGLEARKLLPMKSHVQDYFEVIDTQLFKKGLIFTSIYKSKRKRI